MLNFKKPKFHKKKQKGMAVIEAIPVLFMLVMVFNFSLGFFGALHSGILNSIGAYNYTIETFRYKSNLMYFRPGYGTKNYKLAQNRVHGVLKDGSEQDANNPEEKGVWPATIRDINFNYVKGAAGRDLASEIGAESDRSYRGRTDRNNVWFANSNYTPDGNPIQTTRIWIKSIYGICINADCTVDGDKDRRGE